MCCYSVKKTIAKGLANNSTGEGDAMKCLFRSMLVVFVFVQLYGVKQVLALPAVADVKSVPSNWATDQQRRQASKSDYINDHRVAYDWFRGFAFSETDGTPYILLKLLPEVAPEYWGNGENFLDVVGLFIDPRQSGYPIASGVGISAFACVNSDNNSREKSCSDIDYASFTCAACHIGRVRTANNSYEYIDGGVNTEFNIVKYRVNIYRSLQKIYGDEKDPHKKEKLLVDAFLKALDKVQNRDPNYFYRDFKTRGLHLDSAYERKQIELFRGQADKLIAKFSDRKEAEYRGYGALLDKNYKGFQKRSLAGFPGMADATGISAINGYIAAQQHFYTRWFAGFILPSSPGITDFMSVWEQDKRKAKWDSKAKTLINGGGQWNGNIPIPMYRNLAAQLTLGLEDNDIRVSAFGVELLDGLPATVYPFAVDVELARKGQALFETNCAECHRPHNGKAYTSLGTNMDRSYVVNWLIRRGGISSFNGACSPTTTVKMNGKLEQPCAEFDSVSLVGKKNIIMSPNGEHHGYNARPLSGIWAQGPFLHNGSVPTLYHLLVPGDRPDTFIKSRLDYDTELVGFKWNKPRQPDYPDEGYLFDTRSIPAFSNKGHDKDIKRGVDAPKGRFKLDWSDDLAGAKALLEYMKTL